MSQEIVERVRVKYPTPLGERHGAFLIELARTLGGGAGLLAKDWGTFVELPDGRKVAQDIICYRVPDGAVHYDCLKDGEGVAEAVWQDKGPIDPARYVDVGAAPIPVPPAPVPPPPAPPAPQPPVTCNAVAAGAEVLDALHEIRLELNKQHEVMLMALARLENDNRKARPVTVSGWRTGTLKGEVSGV
jgi:hypothetical protein